MDVTLKFNGYDFAPELSRYTVKHEVSSARIITTLDGTEHAAKARRRPIIEFSLLPGTDAQNAARYAALSVITAKTAYTDSLMGAERSADMRLTSDLEAVFGLRSVDGNRYYKGGTIQLRAVNPID